MGIVAALREFHVRYIVLRRSIILDQLFLANFLRRTYPDGRIVILGSDLMLVRERGSTGLSGAMTLSTYPLFPLERDWTEHQSAPAPDRTFGSDTSEGTYVAFRLLLNDKTMSEAHHLPFIVYSTSADAWSIYQPQGWRAALEGRPFFHGILDCYTLVKDYYDIKLGIKLADFYRPDDWWKTGANMYLEHSKEQGFMEVASPLHVHDVLLMHWQSQVPNHAAVYVEPGLILHHAPGRISGKSPYGGFYAEQTYGIFRHKSLL